MDSRVVCAPSQEEMDDSVQVREWQKADSCAAVDGKNWLYDLAVPARQFDNPRYSGLCVLPEAAHLVDDKIHARATGPIPWSPSSLWAVAGPAGIQR